MCLGIQVDNCACEKLLFNKNSQFVFYPMTANAVSPIKSTKIC